MIKIKDIMISDQIIKQIRKYNYNLDIFEFEKSDRFGGFDLNRIFELNSEEFKNLLETDLIELDLMELKSDKKKYEIRNGRHRVARCIIENIEQMPAKII